MIHVSDAFRSAYPAAAVGVLVMRDVANPAGRLESRKRALEAELPRRYAGFDRPRFKALSIIRAYDTYYRAFGKSYHVLAQVESVAVKGRPIPSAGTLVEAMFMAELEDLLLTAGHDLAALASPLTLDVAAGGEVYRGIRGGEETCKAGDMIIADAAGVISSVLYGPDLRTRIVPETTGVLYTAYAPAGVPRDAIQAHLGRIEAYVKDVSPNATTQMMSCLP